MPPLQDKVGTVHRLLVLSLMLWYPFHTCFVECAVLPINSVLRNETNSFSTVPKTVDFHCSHESFPTDTLLFDHRDCFAAIRYMMFTETLGPFHGSKPHKFSAQKAQSPGRLGPPLLTPQKYVASESRSGSPIRISLVLSSVVLNQNHLNQSHVP